MTQFREREVRKGPILGTAINSHGSTAILLLLLGLLLAGMIINLGRVSAWLGVNGFGGVVVGCYQ